MTSVGERLRQERLRRHWELRQISAELKISPRILEAIEEERFELLPAGVFVKSFVRQYARLLGLDEDEMVAGVEQLIGAPFAIETLIDADPDTKQAPNIRVPRVDSWHSVGDREFSWFSWMPAAALVIAVMLGCSLIYSRWQRSHNAVATLRPPDSKVEMAPVAPPAFDQKPTSTLPETAPEAKAPEAAASAETPAAAAEPPVEAPAGQNNVPPPIPNAAVRVALTAKEKVWISARADGKILFSGMLDENETRTVEANDTLLVRVGNAGAVDVTLNGKSLGTLGAKGQPRTVQFTSGGFQTVAASRRSLPL